MSGWSPELPRTNLPVSELIMYKTIYEINSQHTASYLPCHNDKCEADQPNPMLDLPKEDIHILGVPSSRTQRQRFHISNVPYEVISTIYFNTQSVFIDFSFRTVYGEAQI